ncbi:MAG: hypothetical protein ABIT96_09635 [Ferruginibacter sp.]
MKIITLVAAAALLASQSFAQGKSQGKGNSGKVKSHSNVQQNRNTDNHHQNTTVYNNNTNTTQGKYSKNTPAKVGDAFYRDYPNASNVSWSKDRGDWTATFGNGVWRSTAVYHANGQRKDTRTAIQRQDLPGTTWDRIFRRDRLTPTGEYVRIERPGTTNDLFRIAAQRATGARQYVYYDRNGRQVRYAY